jgi:hypothetical protein
MGRAGQCVPLARDNSLPAKAQAPLPPANSRRATSIFRARLPAINAYAELPNARKTNSALVLLIFLR